MVLFLCAVLFRNILSSYVILVPWGPHLSPLEGKTSCEWWMPSGCDEGGRGILPVCWQAVLHGCAAWPSGAGLVSLNFMQHSLCFAETWEATERWSYLLILAADECITNTLLFPLPCLYLTSPLPSFAHLFLCWYFFHYCNRKMG